MIRRFVVSIVVISIVAFGTWSFLRWANSPVKQRVINSEVHTSTEAAPSIEVVTTYFSTRLPADYRTEIAANPNNPEMIQLSAFPTNSGQEIIGITTGLLPVDGLKGVADYIYRTDQASTYTITETDSAAGTYTFQKHDDSEVTTFLTNDRRYASITVSSQGSTITGLREIQRLILGEWRWSDN
ncbi:MAG: hypothetical protein WBP12_04675 [Candidatus Saccharimonas sp.]